MHTSTTIQRCRYMCYGTKFFWGGEIWRPNAELFAKVNRCAQCTPATPCMQPQCVKEINLHPLTRQTESPSFLPHLPHVSIYMGFDHGVMTETTTPISQVNSSTIESSGPQLNGAGTCEVCGSVTHGSQFGGNACRACAGESRLTNVVLAKTIQRSSAGRLLVGTSTFVREARVDAYHP